MQIELTSYPVELLAAEFRVAGMFTPRGNPAMYINDPGLTALKVADASFWPVDSQTRVGEMKTDELYIPKDQVEILMIGNFASEDASLRPKPIRMLCFTANFAVRATFHVGAETGLDVIFSAPGPFFGATNAEIVSHRSLVEEVHGEGELIYINKHAVRAYHMIT